MVQLILKHHTQDFSSSKTNNVTTTFYMNMPKTFKNQNK